MTGGVPALLAVMMGYLRPRRAPPAARPPPIPVQGGVPGGPPHGVPHGGPSYPPPRTLTFSGYFSGAGSPQGGDPYAFSWGPALRYVSVRQRKACTNTRGFSNNLPRCTCTGARSKNRTCQLTWDPHPQLHHRTRSSTTPLPPRQRKMMCRKTAGSVIRVLPVASALRENPAVLGVLGGLGA